MEMTRLFDAYFHAAEEETLIGTRLNLDPPESKRQHRYHLFARFAPKTGWTVETELKRNQREVRFRRRIPPV
jgi:hypothetical protein